MNLAEKLGKEVGAEVVIATDPDSDRMAIEIPDGKGGYVPLNGNQTGALLIAYRRRARKMRNPSQKGRYDQVDRHRRPGKSNLQGQRDPCL